MHPILIIKICIKIFPHLHACKHACTQEYTHTQTHMNANKYDNLVNYKVNTTRKKIKHAHNYGIYGRFASLDSEMEDNASDFIELLFSGVDMLQDMNE